MILSAHSKISKHFRAEELFSKALFESMPKDRLLQLIDPRILTIADFMRDTFGVCTINDWVFGRDLHNCGFRESRVGDAKYSQHLFGRAVDMHFRDATAYEIRLQIKAAEDKYRACGITAVEDDVSWLHVDCRYMPNCNNILFFKG